MPFKGPYVMGDCCCRGCYGMLDGYGLVTDALKHMFIISVVNALGMSPKQP